MGRPMNNDKRIWSFEPDDDVRVLVDLVVKRTGWTRTRVINNVLSAFTGAYALEQAQAQKAEIEQLETDIINTVSKIQTIITPEHKRKKTSKKKVKK